MGDIINFPTSAPEEPEDEGNGLDQDDVFAETTEEPVPSQRFTIAEMKQFVYNQEVLEVTGKHRGDVAVLGTLLGREDLSQIIGEHLTEEEFVGITAAIANWASTMVTSVVAHMARDLYEYHYRNGGTNH